MPRHIFAAAALSLAALAINTAFAAEAGRIIYVAGSAQIADRAAVLNAPVQEGDMLVTGKDGFIYIQTADNGLFILRPSTKARIATYYIDKKNPANTRVKLELLSGVARSQSGEAVKMARQNFRFNTPVAAIGVRGTDFVVAADHETTRVTVLSGGVTLSGFDGACRPDGAGPCEGAAARELFANQKGMLLQYRRGQPAPQLVPEANSVTPDSIAPPRPDEPAKQGGSASNLPPQPSLDARKTAELQQQVANQNNPGSKTDPAQQNDPIVMVPPVTEAKPEPVQPNTPTEPAKPAEPERSIVWGRWQSLANLPANVDVVAELGKQSKLIAKTSDYALFYTNGREAQVPERGGVAFTLAQGEATIRNENTAIAPVIAKVENGLLSFNFDKRTYATSFDVVNQSERIALQSTGIVASDGRFASDSSAYVDPKAVYVNGFLSQDKGLNAAYVFESRLSAQRTVNGVTYWNNPVVPK
jgi:hypothetical protein